MISTLCVQEELMQKIREQVLVCRDKVYKDNEEEVRKRWHFEDAVSFFSCYSVILLSLSNHLVPFISHSLTFIDLET